MKSHPDLQVDHEDVAAVQRGFVRWHQPQLFVRQQEVSDSPHFGGSEVIEQPRLIHVPPSADAATLAVGRGDPHSDEDSESDDERDDNDGDDDDENDDKRAPARSISRHLNATRLVGRHNL